MVAVCSPVFVSGRLDLFGACTQNKIQNGMSKLTNNAQVWTNIITLKAAN